MENKKHITEHYKLNDIYDVLGIEYLFHNVFQYLYNDFMQLIDSDEDFELSDDEALELFYDLIKLHISKNN